MYAKPSGRDGKLIVDTIQLIEITHIKRKIINAVSHIFTHADSLLSVLPMKNRRRLRPLFRHTDFQMLSTHETYSAAFSSTSSI